MPLKDQSSKLYNIEEQHDSGRVNNSDTADKKRTYPKDRQVFFLLHNIDLSSRYIIERSFISRIISSNAGLQPGMKYCRA